MLKLALRNALRQRSRSAMTVAAVVVGVVSLIVSGGFVHDIVFQLGEALIRSQSGHLQINRLGFHEAGARSPEKFLIEAPGPLRSKLEPLPQVVDVLGRLQFSALLSNGRSDLAVIGEAVEPAREARLGTYLGISDGRQLRDDDEYGALVGAGVAAALKIRPGDPVTLLVGTAGGALNTLDLEVVGVFQSFSRDYDARAVRVHLRAAQNLIETAGVNTLVVALERTRDTAAVAGRLRELLDPSQYEVKTWYELSDFYAKTVDLYERQFGVLRLIILFMLVLGIANSVNMTVLERAGEFGTMMALGDRRRRTFMLIVAEAAVLGLAGSALGVLLGVLLAAAVSAFGIPMPPPPNSDLGYTARIRIVPVEIALAFSVGLVATLAASLLPAWRTARLPLAHALRQNA